jgi:hypothetical protein
MTDIRTRRKLLNLDRCYRETLGWLALADLNRDPGARKRQLPALLRECSRLERAVDELRAAHPLLLDKLEALFRKAHPGARETTRNLMYFAHKKDLLLTGERQKTA